jgi:hypothetical protein
MAAVAVAIAGLLTGCEGPGGDSPSLAPATATSKSAEPSSGAAIAWETIPLVRFPSEAFGSIALSRAFTEAMRTPENPLTVCRTGWKPPPGFGALHLETELRIRARDGFLVVEDVVVLGGNFGDPEYEDCMVRQYRGRRAPAPTVEPGRAFRLDWRIHQYLD